MRRTVHQTARWLIALAVLFGDRAIAQEPASAAPGRSPATAQCMEASKVDDPCSKKRRPCGTRNSSESAAKAAPEAHSSNDLRLDVHCSEGPSKDTKGSSAWEFASAALWPVVVLLVCAVFYRQIRKTVESLAARVADPSTRVSFAIGKTIQVDVIPGEEIEDEPSL